MPSIVTSNTLIKGLCDMSKAQEAMQLLGKMSDFEGCCKPNVITYIIVIDGLCKDESVDCALLLKKVQYMQYKDGFFSLSSRVGLFISCG